MCRATQSERYRSLKPCIILTLSGITYCHASCHTLSCFCNLVIDEPCHALSSLVIRLYDVLHSEHKLTMVFEYCDQDLKKYLDSCRAPPDASTVEVRPMACMSPHSGSMGTFVLNLQRQCSMTTGCVELHVPASARPGLLPQDAGAAS